MSEIVVETTTGKARGMMERGVYTFKGVPYGVLTYPCLTSFPESFP